MQNRTVPTVSVVMPAYNADKYIREAIDSILNQTFSDFEFIIINDGSTDTTKEIILSYDDPRIVYIENEQNSGICVTLNRGLDAARGRYIARMDSDDISLPERFEKQVSYMEAHPEIGVCGTNIEVFYTDKNSPGYVFKFDNDSKICQANLIFSATLAHPTALIRKNILKSNCLRYDDYYRGMEDHNLWWQIAKFSNISNLQEPLLKYRQHPDQITKNSFDAEFKARLRSFIRQRVCDYGVVLNNEEYDAFCLYHENNTVFNEQSLIHFVSACSKIIKQLRKNKCDFVGAQKLVFGKAISYAIDCSNLGQKIALKYQLKALMNNTMSIIWYMKRTIKSITPPLNTDSQIFKTNNSEFNTTKSNRYAFLMYYMHCGGVETALVNLLNRLDYNKNIVDLYVLDAQGEFLGRINKKVNVINLSNILHPVQKHIIITQNIHSTIDYAIKNGYYLKAVSHGLRYAFYKLLNYEMPAYKAAAVSKHIANFTYDKVFDFHGYSSFTSFFGAYKLKAPEKYTWCHSQNIIFGNALKCIYSYNKMFAVSSFIRDLYKKQIMNIPIEIFYNFIDINDIKKRANEGEINALDSNNCIKLMTIGRLSVQKGYDIALQTAKILKDEGCIFKWYFCGEGEERIKLEYMAKELDVENNIVFLGYKENPFGYLQSSDLYVQTSRYEGYALTLMEAVALGKIIVSTDVSGAREAVIDGENGFIVKFDPIDISNKLKILIKDKKLRDKFAHAASATVPSHVASEEMLKKYISQ